MLTTHWALVVDSLVKVAKMMTQIKHAVFPEDLERVVAIFGNTNAAAHSCSLQKQVKIYAPIRGRPLHLLRRVCIRVQALQW